MPTQPRRVILYGNDICQEIALPTGGTFVLTYWDVWFAIILTAHFASDWDKLADHLRQEVKASYSFRRSAVEGFLCHLQYLRQSLDEAGLTVQDLLSNVEPDLLKRQRYKARQKILKDSPPDHEQSFWMRHTPRVEREARALRGYRPRFPVSPDAYAEQMARLFKPSGYYSEDQSFGLERKLSAFIERKEVHASDAERCALYRAFLTVMLEQMDKVDDSYGVIGDLYGGVFDRYIQLDRSTLGMPLADFFQDWIELLIWEDYGFTYQKKPDFFAGLALAEVSLAEAILRTQWDELGKLDLDYQSENALTMLGMLCTQQRMFDRFLDLARAMGTRAWQRITTMSEMAEKCKRYDLAVGVYEACMGPGMHQEFLQKKYAELQGRLQKENSKRSKA
jgi:hypothetical protein